jgi:hypothetical protein
MSRNGEAKARLEIQRATARAELIEDLEVA